MVDGKQSFSTVPKSKYPTKRDAKRVAQKCELDGIITKDTPFREFALEVLEDKKPSERTRETFLQIINHFDVFLKKQLRQSIGNYSEVIKAITGHKDSATIFKYYAHATLENVARGLDITKVENGFMPKVMPKKKKKRDL